MNYHNQTNNLIQNQIPVDQKIKIKLGGIAGIVNMEVNRHYTSTLENQETQDCIFDTQKLIRKTAFQHMYIELNSTQTRTHECTINLSQGDVKGSPVYEMDIIAESDGLHCYRKR